MLTGNVNSTQPVSPRPLNGSVAVHATPSAGHWMWMLFGCAPDISQAGEYRVAQQSRQDPIRVIIADDQLLLREGLAALLSIFPDLSVVGKASCGREAIELVSQHHPDVVLMDIQMPDMNGIAATHRITDHWPSTRVLILTTFDLDEYVYDSLQSGAAGYLLKDADPDHLADAIRAVYQGKSILDPTVTRKVIRRMVHLADSTQEEPLLIERLTDRERSVLSLMADGYQNAEIAERLCLAEGTVKNYVSQILAKLNARDRAHAVRLAVEWGLCTAPTRPLLN